MAANGKITTRTAWGRALRRVILNPRGRNSFVDLCPPRACVLDVGCGNNSPRAFKQLRPDIHYVGIDVGDCRQETDPLADADEYVIREPGDFVAGIEGLGRRFDAVVSNHNLEHCDDPEGTVRAMARALVPGGRLFMAFPSAASVSFPSRAGCLNFFDDPTHRQVPDFPRVGAVLREEGVEVVFAAARYRPAVKVVQGLLVEPVSALRKRVMGGTQALYGFESVIWARRP